MGEAAAVAYHYDWIDFAGRKSPGQGSRASSGIMIAHRYRQAPDASAAHTSMG